MKFSEKLQKLRKEHNITQEGLADKLNVTRQAVSKWESGTAFPDTEKLIQISKIFNVSLDELVNDQEISKEYKSDRINIKDILNIILEFITKTINMFFAMTFREKIKCMIEMFILIFLIIVLEVVSINLIKSLFMLMFAFIPSNYLYAIKSIISSFLYFMLSILGVIIFIKIFKERYLDYYVVVMDKEIEKKEIEKPIPELKDTKDVKVVIRDPEHSSLKIFSKIFKICLFFLKVLCGFFLIPVLMLFILMIIIFIISIFYVGYGLFFNGISVALLGGICFLYLMIEFGYNLIFNQSHVYKRIFMIFIISICMIGLGCGLTVYSLTNFKYIYNDFSNTSSEIIPWDSRIVINEDIDMLEEEKIVIDNNIDYIKIDFKTYDGNKVYSYSYYNLLDDNNYYKVVNFSTDSEVMDFYKYFIDNLKRQQFVLNDCSYVVDKIYISQEHLDIIKDNYYKYYN